MAKNDGGPACPKVDRLEELMDYATAQKLEPPDVEADVDHNNILQEIVEALDWLHTMLSNRKTYHKKRQLIQNARLDVAKKLLSADELKQIDADVLKQLGGE